MTNNSKQRKKQLLALFLSAMMTTSFTVALASCKDDDTTKKPEEETTDTTVEKDTARLTNGSFEYFDDNDGKKLIITSPGSWSRSNASGGSTSKSASGIINTATDAWKNLTTASGEKYDSVDTAKANWDKLTAYDKLNFYEEQNDEDELDFYENYNIDLEDVPTCENPRTHSYDANDATTEDKANVLMIHNNYNVSGKYGTAQRFTSSTSITIQAGTYAELSLWVKTSDLKFGSKEQEVIADRGAYIDITQTVGGTTLDTLQVKNINTELQNTNGDNNGWVQYTFYVQGCSYATSTVKVELGLGQAKVSSNTWEYVSGYAFFDDVECKIYGSDSTTKGWSTATANVDVANQFDMLTDKDKKIVKADVTDATVFSMDMDKTDTPFVRYNVSEGGNVTTALTEEKGNNGKTYVSATDVAGKETYSGLTLNAKQDFKGILSPNNLPDHQFVTKVADKLATPSSFNSAKMILLLSTEGAAYTADVKDSTEFAIKPNEYFALSFFVKTSDLAGHTGAGAKLVEVDNQGNPVGNESALTSIDTTANTSVDIDTDEGKQEDIYKGWQQCFFFVENDTDETRYFELKLTYGSTTIIGTKNSDYYGGFAAFANFETRSMSDKEYGYASDGSYAKKFSLKGATEENTDGKFFDEASQVGGNVEHGIQLDANDVIVKGLAAPVNYKGVYGGSGFVTDDETNIEQDWYSAINGNKFAGLINKKELANWDANDYNNAIKTAVENKIGDATQPLLIYNNQATSYGFIGKNQTISANTYATVSVRVMVSANAQANVYLIDTDDKSHEKTLGWSSGVTYWYDDDGNVCTKDPASNEFKKTDVAFKLQSNGLYQVNTKWSGYAASGVNATDYFANLSNYEKDEVTNDLLVAENGVSYDYNAKWQNDGNDGIAFYYKDGAYYAYSNYTTPVKDLATVTGLTPRYEAQAEKTLATKVEDTNGKWVTVTFYLHTGSVAKNYRLEVWSGTREGYANPADTFVMFDASGATTLTAETFTSIVDLSKERINDANLTDYTGEIIEGVYSFYDAKDFLRYDSSIDENKVGDSYESYVSSVYEEGTAYMTYEDGIQLIKATFVDFNLSEQTVAADVEEEDTEEEVEEETTTSETNMWLLVSSIIIAVVLLLAVVSIIVRKFVEKARKKKARSSTVRTATAPRKVKKGKIDKQ